MGDTIVVTGYIDVEPANRDAAVEAIKTLMAASQAEEGCEDYAFSADLNEPARFRITEQWRDQEAMDEHNKTPHLAAFMGALRDLKVTGTSLTMWTGAEKTKLF